MTFSETHMVPALFRFYGALSIVFFIAVFLRWHFWSDYNFASQIKLQMRF